ncbi:hypothetical protein WDU94_011851 [Cyamophila willieti]
MRNSPLFTHVILLLLLEVGPSKINKEATAKSVQNTPKAPPPVRSLDKKPKGKALKQVTHLRIVKNSKINRLTFLSSLSDNIPDSYSLHPEAGAYKTDFESNKEDLTRRLFYLFNREVFEERLPYDMSIKWNGRMGSSAFGSCNTRIENDESESYSVQIELSKKLINTPNRLRDTLIHELCHAASWLIDGMRDGHGRNWKKWTIHAIERFPELSPIKRWHYNVDAKYEYYRCFMCDHKFKRSKFLKIKRKGCDNCHGNLSLVSKSRQGQPLATEKITKRPLNQFALFVKENYARVKQENVGIKHGDVMKLLSQKFAQNKLKNG